MLWEYLPSLMMRRKRGRRNKKKTTKRIRNNVFSATNPAVFPGKLKIKPTTALSTAGNASTAFPASLLSASANLSNHFFKAPSSFSREPPVPLPPPKSSMTESAIVAILAKRAERVEIIVTICSPIKIPVLSGKGVFLSRTFSRVFLILGTCV